MFQPVLFSAWLIMYTLVGSVKERSELDLLELASQLPQGPNRVRTHVVCTSSASVRSCGFYASYACVHDICLVMAYAKQTAQIDVAFEDSSKNGCKGGLCTEQSGQQGLVLHASSVSSSQLTSQRAYFGET